VEFLQMSDTSERPDHGKPDAQMKDPVWHWRAVLGNSAPGRPASRRSRWFEST
jgi:hypothetical protein